MKNTKIKIETGSEKLTKEEISTHKDFSKVYKTYTTTTTNTSTVKTPKKFGGMTSVVVVTTTVVVTTIGAWKYWSNKKSAEQPKVTTSSSTNSSSANKTASVNKTAKPYISPPIKSADVPYKTFSVDVATGGTLTYNNSKIVIPAGAFCDDKGNPIKGKVDIKYREFHNAIDFFASGIPMTYDSAGQQYTFESAGMLDVRGYQDSKQVYIMTGKEIQVSMVSTQKKLNYNMYELDTVNQNWKYLSKSNGKVMPVPASAKKDTAMTAEQKQQVQQLQNSIVSAKQQETQVEKTKPVAPEKVSKDKYTFNIDVDKKDYPELAVYKNTLWAPDASDKNYKPEYANITWDDASLKKNDDGKTYTFTVKKGNESHSFMVHPVFEGSDYETAMKEYNKKYDQYQAARNQRLADEQKARDEYAAEVAKIKQQQAEQEARMLASNTASAVTYYLSINRFGIYNTDCPSALPHGAELTPNYTDNKNENLNENEFYLVESDKNAVYMYHPGHDCRFNPASRNFAFMVTNANEIALYSADDFKNIHQTSGSYNFVLTVQKKVTSFDDLSNLLKPYM